MHLLTLNAAGKSLAPPRALAPSRRRLSQVIGRHVDRSRPHMIAVQRARDPLQPIGEAWVVRGRDKAGKVKAWPRLYLPADAIVAVVYLPRGGGSSGGGSSGKSTALSIVAAIAAVTLAVFSGPLGATVAAAIGISATTGALVAGGIVVGATALQAIVSRSQADKKVTDRTQVYGVSGGGNTPKPGDRIPRGYGRSWMKPDLSQPDFSQYDGDDQILFKRHTLGVGKYHPYQVRAGKQVIWSEAAGFVAPFNDARNAIEFVSGTASTLVPNSVVSAAGVGGLLPRPSDNPALAGPYLINQRGALITRIQVDYQFPQGISRTHYFTSGNVQSNQPGGYDVRFEYASIDESGAITSDWRELYYDNSGKSGARFATHPLRFTRFLDVPAGRYAVRGSNGLADTSQNDKGNASIDACQWDGASGWVADPAIRDGVTEMAMRIYATKATGAAAFGEVEIDAGAIIPVWDGTTWTEQETSKAVWAFLDVMRNQDYGGALPDDQLDLGTALGYARSLAEFDTFDGTIRGPVSVYEAAASVLLPMRAEPVHLGRFWSLVRDEPKSVRRHVITRSQIVKGSTQVVFDLDLAAGAGHVVGEFDQDGDYRNPNQTTAIYGEASLTPTRQRWTGVRTFAHAQHLTRWRAASGAYRRRTTPFGVEMEGRIYKRGDSIAVDQWFVDTRRKASVVFDVGNVLTLDADIVVQAGDAAILRDRTGREWGPLSISQGASAREIVLDAEGRAAVEAAAGVALSRCLSDGRGEMTPVLVGPLSVLRENYLIQSVKPSGPSKASVEALIDDTRVWDAIGATPVVPPTGAGGLSDPESPHIVGLSANAVQMAAGFRCDYAINPGRGAVSFEVGLSHDDGSHYETIYTGNATIGSQVLNPVDPSVLRLRARAFGSTGLPGPYYLTAINLPAPAILGSLLDDFSVTIEKLSAQAQFDLASINDLGQGLLALDQASDNVGIKLAADTIRGGLRQLEEAIHRLADASATETTNAYLQRQLIKVGNSANFAAIERVDEARISDKEAFSATTTTLASRLTLAEGSIVGNASAIQGLSTSVAVLDGRVTSQSQSITALSSRIDANDLTLSGQAAAVQGLTTRVSLTEGNILSVSQAVTSLQSTVAGQGGQIGANAQAINTLTTQTSNLQGQYSAQATALQALQTTVGSHTATLTTYGTSIDGVKVQFGVTGSIDGTTGGFVFTGVRRLDGSVAYTFAIRGDAIVDGTLYARALAANTITTAQLTTGQLIVNGHIFDNAISTVKGAESSGPSSSYTYTNSRGVGTRVAIFAFYSGSGPNTVPNASSAGTLMIRINGSTYKSVAAQVFPFSGNFYLSSQAICKQVDLGTGTFTIEALQNNIYGYGACDVLLMEISK